MKRIYLWAVAFGILQVGIAWKFPVWGVVPNIVLIVSLTVFLSGRFFEGWILALLGSFTLDLLGPGRFGAMELSTIVVFFCLERLTTHYLLEPPWWSKGIALLIALVFWNLLTSVLLGNVMISKVVLDAVLGTLLGTLIFLAIPQRPSKTAYEHL